MQCKNNLRQVGLALLSFNDSYGHFPQGTYDLMDDRGTVMPQNRRCWMQDLLPYIEFGSLYKQFDSYMQNPKNSALVFPGNLTVIPTLVCPDDRVSPKIHTFSTGEYINPDQGFSGNIVLCAGSNYFNPTGPASSKTVDGLCFAQSNVTTAQITDGTSHTAASTEIILSPDVTSNDIRGRYYNPSHGGVLFTTRITPNTLVPDVFDYCSDSPVQRAPCTDAGFSAPMFLSAKSYHNGGVNLGMADASVTYVADEVDATIYKGLGTRGGGEINGGL